MPAPADLIPADLLDQLAERALSLQAHGRELGRRAVLGIAGVPGAGKSTVAEALVARLAGGDWRDTSVAHVPMDGFHLADMELARLGRADRKGAPDTFDADGFAALLGRIRGGEQVLAPDFDRTIEQPIAGSLPVTANAELVITEGNYLLLPDPQWQRVRALLDEVWFVSGDDDVRRERLVARHIQFGKSPDEAAAWVEATDEPNARLIMQHADTADLIVEL